MSKLRLRPAEPISVAAHVQDGDEDDSNKDDGAD